MADVELATVHPIHPFPARMAPEIALAECAPLGPGSLVLDPMAGSGTVLRSATERGHRALGFDMDPLAVLIAKVWTTPIHSPALRDAADQVVERATALDPRPALPSMDSDKETRAFVDYWFASEQQADLRKLSAVLLDWAGPIGDALRVALSRIIITKDRGASLARDVSHSRPHRAFENHDFPVMREFLRSARRLAQRLEQQPPPGGSLVATGDARHLSGVAASSVDAVITSPPYLNAIDYLRGHRLSLVWLGHRIGDLRRIRAGSVGAERAPDVDADAALAAHLTSSMGPLSSLPGRERRMVNRYALDVFAMLEEFRRVLRPTGKAVLVVGNSCVRGVFVENALVVSAAAERAGFRVVNKTERHLPPARRYLPPPAERIASGIDKRMRTETVLAFAPA